MAIALFLTGFTSAAIPYFPLSFLDMLFNPVLYLGLILLELFLVGWIRIRIIHRSF